MKKRIIIATVLCVVGLIVSTIGLALMDFDFSRLNSSEYVTREYSVDGDFSDISVITQICDVTFVPADDGKCRVVVYAPENRQMIVFAKDGSLTVHEHDGRKWYQFIGINLGNAQATVYLPKTQYGVLTIESDTGDVILPQDFTFASVKLTSDTGDVSIRADITEGLSVEADTGDIKMQSISARSIKVESDTGDVEIGEVTVEREVSVESDTGDVSMTQLRCGNLTADTDTGNLLFTDTVAEFEARLSTDTGKVVFDAFDAHDIFVETSTGDVMGTILSEKVFFAKSKTGKEDVPYSLNGGACEVKSDTGDIRLSIADKEK